MQPPIEIGDRFWRCSAPRNARTEQHIKPLAEAPNLAHRRIANVKLQRLLLTNQARLAAPRDVARGVGDVILGRGRSAIVNRIDEVETRPAAMQPYLSYQAFFFGGLRGRGPCDSQLTILAKWRLLVYVICKRTFNANSSGVACRNSAPQESSVPGVCPHDRYSRL